MSCWDVTYAALTRNWREERRLTLLSVAHIHTHTRTHALTHVHTYLIVIGVYYIWDNSIIETSRDRRCGLPSSLPCISVLVLVELHWLEGRCRLNGVPERNDGTVVHTSVHDKVLNIVFRDCVCVSVCVCVCACQCVCVSVCVCVCVSVCVCVCVN